MDVRSLVAECIQLVFQRTHVAGQHQISCFVPLPSYDCDGAEVPDGSLTQLVCSFGTSCVADVLRIGHLGKGFWKPFQVNIFHRAFPFSFFTEGRPVFDVGLD